MSRRKGELTIDKIRKVWPHSVIVPREVFDTSVPIDAAYPSMAPRNSSVLFAGRQFVRADFKDAEEAEIFRSRARGWTFVQHPSENRAETVWPPRNPRATAS